jgi:MFS family permease
VVAFAGILLGMFSSIIMQTILATVLPDVVNDLGDAYLYSWVFSGYLIASTITIPIFAKLADLYGRKRFYLGGMVVFLAGSALSGTANSMDQLVIYRVVQGLGVIFPTLLLSGQNAVAENQRAVVGGLVQISRNLGGAIGIPAFTGFIAPTGGKIIGGNESSAYLTLFLLLSMGSAVGVAVGLRFKGSIYTDQKAQIKC